MKYAEIKRLEALAEVFGVADKNFKKNEVVYNVGARYEVGKHYSLLASIDRSFHRAADQPTLLSYLGLQLRF